MPLARYRWVFKNGVMLSEIINGKINLNCHQNSNDNNALVGNEIVDHSDVAGASPVGAAPTSSSFST